MTDISQNENTADEMPQNDEEWESRLTPLQYRVTREGGTEQAFSGEYWDTKDQGTYRCVGCGAPLFRQRNEVRLWLGLAELHPATRRSPGRRAQ